MPIISALYDIKSLIERYANIDCVGRPCNVRGVTEYHSNCPWCGGTDRFVTRPETGQFSCAIRSSGCGRTGDGIDFLKEYCNMTHAEAREVLGLEQNADFVPSTPSKSSQNSKESPPPARWQETGVAFVARAEAALWSPSGAKMLDYLRGRGLKDETIKKHRLGYIPLQSDGRFYQASFETWGLTPDMLSDDQLAKGCVRVPNGILIPWFEGDTLWRLSLERPGDTPKKTQVLGSKDGLYNVSSIDMDRPVMMAESVLCALSVEQEAEDLIACVATGSTTQARLSRWWSDLSFASFMLQSFDEDAPLRLIYIPDDKRDANDHRGAGDEGADYWLKMKNSMRWSPCLAKDPNDILNKKFFGWVAEGFSIREWVQLGIETFQREMIAE